MSERDHVFEFIVRGRIILKMDEKLIEGPSDTYNLREFVIKVFEEYPRDIKFDVWNGIDIPPVGSIVDVAFSIRSREYQKKWYTTLRAYRIDIIRKGDGFSIQSTPSIIPPDDDDLPF